MHPAAVGRQSLNRRDRGPVHGPRAGVPGVGRPHSSGNAFLVAVPGRSAELLHQLVPAAVDGHHSLDRGHHRDGQQGTGDPEERRPGEHRAERHGRMDLQRGPRDPRRDQVVLDLLVADHDDEHDQGLEGFALHQGDDDRQGPSQVGADRRDELRHHADPEGHRQPVGQVEQEEGDPMERRADHRQQATGDHVATGLLGRDVHDGQERALPVRRKPRGDGAAEARPVGGEVEREQQDREQGEHPVDGGAQDAEQAHPKVLGDVGDVIGAQPDALQELVGVQLRAETGVRPLQDRLEECWQAPDQLRELIGQERAEHREEGHGGHEQPAHDHEGAHPAADAALLQVVHHRLHGQADEEREEQRVPERRELAEAPGDDLRGGDQDQDEDDGPPEPRRQAAIVLGIGDGPRQVGQAHARWPEAGCPDPIPLAVSLHRSQGRPADSSRSSPSRGAEWRGCCTHPAR